MPSVTRRPSTAAGRRSQIETQVYAAVERLLAGGASFTELGVRRIADEAGIARSTFYQYFPDKTHLLLRMVEMLGRHAFEITDTVEITLPGITEVLTGVFAFYRERAHAFAAVIEVASYEPTVRVAWDEILKQFVERTAGWLRAEQRAGRTPADLDPDSAAEVIIWGGIRVISEQITTRGPERDLTVARELAANQWFGSFRRPPLDQG